MLEQDPDRHLVREPDVLARQPALADLASQHLDVLGYPGPLQLGLFTVLVTAPDGSQAQTQFMVIPAGAAPPPA